MGISAFESGVRKAIPAVLIYARSGGRVLMIHRNAGDTARPGDYHSGKWNGLGGKSEADESPLESAQREFHEEAGIDLPLEAFRPLGVLTFPNFKALKKEDWMVFVFTIEMTAADVARVSTRNDEGELHWVPVSDLHSLSLWAGDRHFMPYVAENRSFIGTIWYQGQEVLRYWIQAL